ncbi:MAG: indole-3-glycerol phosphate synthase TrpC [Saprospiraceae bacterium]|nr:indole-3-glycerol phosphate synthase TrpC [Saprospiraceae bacterium]
MVILDNILASKKKEVESRKELIPIKLLERSIYFNSQPISLKKYIQRPDKVGIIAEFKRKSPSKGDINKYVSVERTSIGYMQAGASGLSILTDTDFFGGSSDDLKEARTFNYCPILRKDFIIDPYQVIEAKSIGADAILLIAAALNTKEIASLSKMAASFGMEVLLEIHGEDELNDVSLNEIHLIGVNNRNLQTFETEVATSIELADKIPSEVVKISESGIDNPKTILELMKHGFDGFLIGEFFMKHGRPEKACAELISKIKAMKADQE